MIHATNQLFQTFEALEQQKNSLEAQRETMLQKEVLVQKQKKAVYEVLPLKEAMEEASASKVKVDQALKIETESLEATKQAVSVETEQLKLAEESRGLAQEKEKEALLISQSEEQYRKRDELRSAKSDIEKKKENLFVKKEEMVSKRSVLETAMTTGKLRVEEIAESPALYVTVQQVCEKLEERKERLSKLSAEIINPTALPSSSTNTLASIEFVTPISFDVNNFPLSVQGPAG